MAGAALRAGAVRAAGFAGALAAAWAFWFSTTKVEQAVRHSSLLFSMPMPITSMPAVRSRTDRAEKSLSLEAMMTVSTPPSTSRSIAPITSAMSEEFLPLLALMVRFGWMAYFSTGDTHAPRAEDAPKISRRTTLPRLAAWSKIRSALAGSTFSASIRIAMFLVLAVFVSMGSKSFQGDSISVRPL